MTVEAAVSVKPVPMAVTLRSAALMLEFSWKACTFFFLVSGVTYPSMRTNRYLRAFRWCSSSEMTNWWCAKMMTFKSFCSICAIYYLTDCNLAVAESM